MYNVQCSLRKQLTFRDDLFSDQSEPSGLFLSQTSFCAENSGGVSKCRLFLQATLIAQLCKRKLVNLHENGEKKEGPEGQNSLSVLNYTQITTNNISGLLCRSRPLRLIPETLNLETKLSLKNEIVTSTSQNTSRKINEVLNMYLQEILGGQEKPVQKTREKDEKSQKRHDLPKRPKNKKRKI